MSSHSSNTIKPYASRPKPSPQSLKMSSNSINGKKTKRKVTQHGAIAKLARTHPAQRSLLFCVQFLPSKNKSNPAKEVQQSLQCIWAFSKWKNGLYFVKPRPFIKTPKKFFRVRSVFSATETRDVRPSWVKANEQRRAIAERNIWISNLTKIWF